MKSDTLKIFGLIFSLFVSCQIFALPAPAAGSEPVKSIWLDELEISDSPCGWGFARVNLSVEQKPLSIGGKRFERGVGNHAPSEITLLFGPQSQPVRFTAQVGINDDPGSQGPASFQVFSEQKLLYDSGPMSLHDPAKSIDLPLDGVRVLRLVSNKGDVYYGDHTTWAEAGIEYCGKAPTVPQYQDANGQFIDVTDELGCEWLDLTEQLKTPMAPNVVEQTLHPAATILPTDRDPLDVVLRRLEPLIQELRALPDGPALTGEAAHLQELSQKARTVPTDQTDARKKLFAEAVSLRRQIAFQNPLLSFRDVFFIKRHPAHQAEERGNHMCDQFFGFNAFPGGGIFVLKDAFTDHPRLVNSLEQANAQKDGLNLTSKFAFLSPELSYDNQEIFFAATDASLPRSTFTWTDENCFHIFKAKFNPETGQASDISQLTRGAFNDFDPCCLPSGRIAFISERRGGFGRCHPRIVPTYTLYSMEPDGSDVTMLSAHETNEWQPDVDHHGMIIYTRWDYVDRGANNAHHPWVTTPDGRDPRALHGNYSLKDFGRPIFEADIHPIPNSTKITAIACAHHGQNFGSLILVDPQVRDDNKMGPIRRITPEQLFPESELPIHKSPARYGTCRPLSEKFYLVSFDAFGRGDRGKANNYGIYLLDCFGNRVLLYRDPKISCCDAQPLRPRTRQSVVPHKTLVGVPGTKPGQAIPKDQLPKSASIGLINVYDTSLPFPKNPDGSDVRISRLRIVQLLPKTTPLESRPWIGYGHQKGARRVLGTVPVESDGSAYFELPVNIPVYFQALDEQGVAVQSMRSDTYVHEGEELVCQGCHEDRHSSLRNRPAGMPSAFQRQPSTLQPDPNGSDPMNFALLIQPILEAKCVKCHAENAGNPKAIDLSRGPEGKHFFNSFENLKPYCFFYDHYLWTGPQTLPGKFGARASKLWQILNSEHYGLMLTDEEKYRFSLWMDTNCDFYGTYEDCELQRSGQPVPIRLE